MEQLDPRNDGSEQLAVRVGLLSHPPLWRWEIIGTPDGDTLENGWNSRWAGYETSRAAWQAGLSRLMELRETRSAAAEAMGSAVYVRADGTARHCIVVERQAIGLYQTLANAFSDTDRIKVILDRRVGERRWHGDGPPESDRRRRDRRQPEVATRVHLSESTITHLFDLAHSRA